MTQDQFVARQREMEEQQREFERARVRNVQRFTQMWLTLGQDCIRAANSQHQPEIAEALGLATHRWSRLLDLEQQIIREEQTLATRGKTRPTERGDELLPDRTLAQRDAAYLEETQHRKAALADLREQAKRERADLESLIVKSKARG